MIWACSCTHWPKFRNSRRKPCRQRKKKWLEHLFFFFFSPDGPGQVEEAFFQVVALAWHACWCPLLLPWPRRKLLVGLVQTFRQSGWETPEQRQVIPVMRSALFAAVRKACPRQPLPHAFLWSTRNYLYTHTGKKKILALQGVLYIASWLPY